MNNYPPEQTPQDQPHPFSNEPAPQSVPSQPGQGYQPQWNAPADATGQTPTPAAYAQAPVMGQSEQGAYQTPSPTLNQPRRRSKKPFIIAGAALLIAVLGGVYTFAFYIPSRPENMWSAGLGNTGSALTSLNSALTSKENLDKQRKFALDGSFTAASPADKNTGTDATTFKGTLSAKADDADVNAEINASVVSGSTTFGLGLDVLSSQASDAAYPDSYIKITGLKSINADMFYPGIGQYEDKWIGIPASYWEQTLGGEKNDSKPVTREDIAGFTTAVTKVVSDDVFTPDTSESLLERKSFVGNEKKNDRSSYHYTAIVNQTRASAFCNDLSDAVHATELYKKLESDTTKNSDDVKDCVDYFKKTFPDSKTIDVWIDSRYRVLSALRFSPGSDGKDTTEVGQRLGDLNKPSFYVKSTNTSGAYDFGVTYDRTSLQSDYDLSYSDKKETGETTVKAHATMKPYGGAITVTPPTTSTDITKVFNQLSPVTNSGSAVPSRETPGSGADIFSFTG